MHQTNSPAAVTGQTPVGPLLRTRFAVPALPAEVVVRDRLVDTVSSGVRGPMTLVSAPAGSGKTVLLSSWLETRVAPGPVVWMTMDDGDERPGVFWAYVIEGLLRAGVDLDGAGAPERPETVTRPLLDRIAVRIAARTEPVVLVLDEGGCLVEPALGGDLGYLLRHCDGRLRVVLATRTDPALPLHRYRLDGTLTEVRAADLAFTADETTELIRRSSLDLDPTDVAALVARTGGWPAGLKFAAMSLAGRNDPEQAIREFTGDDGDVAAYLVSEVLDAQPPRLREVLLRTSVVDHLEPGLLSALTGEPVGRRTLEFMAHGNSFIEPAVGFHGYYRYQPLFREFLRAQLRFERPDLVPELHGLAAEWFAASGQRRPAVEHAAAAGSWADAARYLVEDLGIAALLVGRTGRPLTELFDALPDAAAGVEVGVVRAALALTAGDVEACGAELSRVRESLRVAPTRSTHACWLSLALIEARLGHRTAQVDAGLAALERAEHLLRSVDTSAGGSRAELEALLAESRGELLLLAGDLDPARAALAVAARACDAPGSEDVLAAALAAGSLVEALSGRLRHAAELADRADSVARSAGAVASTAARAWIEMEAYSLDAARDLVCDLEIAVTPDDRVAGGVLALVRARLLRAEGDLEGARAVLRAARDAPSGTELPSWLAAWLGAADAAALIAQGHPDEALDAIEALQEPDRPEPAAMMQLARIARGDIAAPAPVVLGLAESSPLDTRVTAWLVQATRAASVGDEARVRTALERALRLAAPQCLRRPFKEASPAVRRMLRPGSHLATQHPWLDAVPADPNGAPIGEPTRSTPAAGPARVAGIVVEPLTRKEQEVLEHLADLLGTDEIASAMYVSVNTVRTHVRSILRKLGAPRRNEAIRRAWELGLLPAPGAGAVPGRPADGPPAHPQVGPGAVARSRLAR